MLMALGIDFQKDFDAFWVAKRSQVGSKIVPKIDPGGVLGGSWWVLGGSWRPTPKNEVSSPFFGALLGPSWGRLGAVLAVSWAVLPSKMVPESEKNRSQNRLKFGCLLGSVFYRICSNFWCPNGGKLAPKSILNQCYHRKTIF